MTDEELSKIYSEELMGQMLLEQELTLFTSDRLADHIKSDHKREVIGWRDFEDLKVSHQLMHEVQTRWNHRH